MDVTSAEPEVRVLMLAGSDGDANAYRSLLEKLSSQLRAYFKGKLSHINRGDVEAEDLVQETLLAIHTRRHTYDSAQPFTPWVYAIARYKFIDYLRRTKISEKEVPANETEELTARDDRSEVESSLDLDRLLTKLSPKMRQVIQYMKLDGLSVRETAGRLGMSESAVKVSVHRGLKNMARSSTRRANHEDRSSD